jgi:hypothetical protein
MILELVVVVL